MHDPVLTILAVVQGFGLTGLAVCNIGLAQTVDGWSRVPGYFAASFCGIGAVLQITMAFDLVRPYTWFI